MRYRRKLESPSPVLMPIGLNDGMRMFIEAFLTPLVSVRLVFLDWAALSCSSIR